MSIFDFGKNSQKNINNTESSSIGKILSGNDKTTVGEDVFESKKENSKEVGYSDNVNSKDEAFDKHIYGKLNSDAPNGKIDKDFKQGHTGDCWLLASIKAIANTEKGQQYLNDIVTTNKDGSVTVELKGPEKKYTISPGELIMSTQLSSGDMDVRAIEIAVKKYMDENSYSNLGVFSNFIGNKASTAYNLLLGQGGNLIGDGINYLGNYLFGISDRQIDEFNNPNRVNVVSAQGGNTMAVKGGTLTTDHTYAVLRSDKNYVYLANPWDTKNEIKLTRDQFKNYFYNTETLDIA